MITIDEYSKLNATGKIMVLLKHEPIAKRADEEHYYHLYQLGSFYTEVKINRQNNCRQVINVFDEMELIEPYLEQMKIPALF